MIGYKPRINTKDDERNMRLYLKKLFKDKLVTPRTGLDEEFMPMGAPLLDFLTVDTEGSTGWKYPRLEELRSHQANRGLTYESRVHLLLGVKNTRIQPTLIKVLPSGVGVYLSPFKEIWGSRIIFAGPNKEFARANKEQIGGSNHAVYMLNQDIEEIQGLGSSKKVRFESEGEVLTSFYTSPIEDDILQEMGFEPCFELEKYIDEPGFLVNFLNTEDKKHFCSVHKAVIPIARLRVLLDQDDVGDTVTFRCPKCSKCMTCKKSQRITAFLLQEAREQVIIEQSIKICEESNTVIAKYPFLKDPVEFLTKRHNGQDNKKQALKVYQGQCRKSEEQKEGMRIVHRDLVEKGFMTRLKDMNEDAMDYIKNGRFYIYSG